MNGEKKVILHLVFDGVLFDLVYPRFEQMQRYENRYLLDVYGNIQQLQFIKNAEKIIRAGSIEEWGNVISDPEVDIVYLHGLWQNYLNAVDYIRQDVVVMWWCYGMDIYENVLRWPPLLPQKLYKPRTHWFSLLHIGNLHNFTAELSYSMPKLYIIIVNFFYYIKGRKENRLKQLLSRIDYIFTPLESEFVGLKKNNPNIKAKRYILRRPMEKGLLDIHQQTGGVLLEHSAGLTNNHLDIIAVIKKKKIDLIERDVFIPLSYGNRKLAERVKEKASFKRANVHCLMDPLPFNEYTEMMSGCTHAIFGMLRQSGLGNIYLCFQKGIKVFLFKDSILFKKFKNDGYYVYSIDDDLNDSNIKEPLTLEQAVHNYNLFYTQFDGSAGSYDKQFDNILNS